MYSLLFVSLVKPQYKMYCDIVHKTGAHFPEDYESHHSHHSLRMKKRSSKEFDPSKEGEEGERRGLHYC